jgi:phosphonate utilization transcriptional regulator
MLIRSPCARGRHLRFHLNPQRDLLSIVFCRLLTIRAGPDRIRCVTAIAYPTIALLQTSSLASVVQQEIERAILQGEFAPGSKLVEAAIAEKLGVSRGPVREAFRMLEEAGLVRTEKNRGVFVRDIPIEEAVEIFDLRAAMDELVGRRLAASITAPQMKELKALVEGMEKAVRAADTRQYHLLNLKFHDRLVEMAGNSKLTAIYRKLIKELSLFRRLNLADSWLMPISANEHRQILKSIGSGDGDAAGRAMFEHVMASKERTIENDQRRRERAAANTKKASRAARQ